MKTCADAGGTNHCPYATPFNYASTYPWKQGRTWVAPGIYAEETGTSNTTPNNTAHASGETNLGVYGNSQLRLWQTRTDATDSGKYVQSIGLPTTSSLTGTWVWSGWKGPATGEAYAHVITLTMW